MYSRQQSGPGGPAAASAPPNMQSSNANSKPSSDYSNYNYGSYSADQTSYGIPRSYGNDAGSQLGGYTTSQPPNAGAKHFNDFKEWPSSWQPLDNMCSNNFTPQIPMDNRATKNINIFFNGIKTLTSYLEGMDISNRQILHADNNDDEEHGCQSDGVTLKHISNLSNMSMCCNSWKRVGLINVKRAAGLVTPAKLNYSD